MFLCVERNTFCLEMGLCQTSGRENIANKAYAENLLPTIIFIIFWDFLMFYQVFLSLQVKRWMIISYKHGIYELPHELPNDLTLRILGN